MRWPELETCAVAADTAAAAADALGACPANIVMLAEGERMFAGDYAAGGNRTHTPRGAAAFEAASSTSSDTAARTSIVVATVRVHVRPYLLENHTRAV